MEIESTYFDILGLGCTLWTCPSKDSDGNLNGLPAEYQIPEGIWTVYLWEDIGEKIQRPLLFHEAVEIYHMEEGIEKTLAHNAAMFWEKRFCKDYLTDSELKEYLLFKKEQGSNGFEVFEELRK